MRIEPDQYKVRLCKNGDGWNLESDRLSHGCLWYRSVSDAISYAEWNSHVDGCRIEILNENDEVVRTEESSAVDFPY